MGLEALGKTSILTRDSCLPCRIILGVNVLLRNLYACLTSDYSSGRSVAEIYGSLNTAHH